MLAKDISYSLVANRRGVGIVGGGREGGVEKLENGKSLISSGVGVNGGLENYHKFKRLF